METANRFPFAHQPFAVWMLIIERRRRVAATLVTARRRRQVRTDAVVVVDDDEVAAAAAATGRDRFAGVVRDQSGQRQLTLIRAG